MLITIYLLVILRIVPRLRDSRMNTSFTQPLTENMHLRQNQRNETYLCLKETVRKLLEAGANIGMKNHFDEVPISKILPDTMEEFLDEFCLDATRDVHHEDFEITFNYSFLAPPR